MGCLAGRPDFRVLDELADLYAELGEPVAARYPLTAVTRTARGPECTPTA